MYKYVDREELHISKRKTHHGYDIVHTTFSGELLLPAESQFFESLHHDNIVFYLKGVCFGKNNKKIHIYNGITSSIKNSFFPNSKTLCLEEKELESILKDSHLFEEFKDKIETIH